MLRGNHPARVDDKGRLKVPNGFRVLIEQQYGQELFVTSVTGEYVRVYPMAVWLEIERRLAEVPSTNPSKLRFVDRVLWDTPTHAEPDVWTDRKGFNEKAADYAAAAKKLTEIADSGGDSKTFLAQLSVTHQTCDACHMIYHKQEQNTDGKK